MARIARLDTAPTNMNSIQFHTRMGFQIEPGNATMNGISVALDYLGKDDHKVLFMKELA
jgi:predicted GNAT superfamily acetyltransferase